MLLRAYCFVAVMQKRHEIEKLLDDSYSKERARRTGGRVAAKALQVEGAGGCADRDL